MGNGKTKEQKLEVRRSAPLWPAWPEEMESLLDRAWRGFGLRPWIRPRLQPWLSRDERWLPNIDVFEREGKLIVRADLPGLKREDIEVVLEGDTLVIRGHRAEEKEVKEEGYYRCERASGEFYRAIDLPEGVKPESIEAGYKDGVLEVSVPTPVAKEAKKMKVQVK